MRSEPATTLPEAREMPERPVSRGSLGGYASAALQWALPAAIVLAALGIWEAAVRAFNVARWLLPPPSSIGAELLESRALLLRHTWVTLGEVLLGFALALGGRGGPGRCHCLLPDS